MCANMNLQMRRHQHLYMGKSDVAGRVSRASVSCVSCFCLAYGLSLSWLWLVSVFALACLSSCLVVSSRLGWSDRTAMLSDVCLACALRVPCVCLAAVACACCVLVWRAVIACCRCLLLLSVSFPSSLCSCVLVYGNQGPMYVCMHVSMCVCVCVCVCVCDNDGYAILFVQMRVHTNVRLYTLQMLH
jgi:hypothetical protein